ASAKLSSSLPATHPPPTLFPYTTLFRSLPRDGLGRDGLRPPGPVQHGLAGRADPDHPRVGRSPGCPGSHRYPRAAPVCPGRAARSEEHTSELQSRENLVCRLLLEKKNRA